MFTSWTQLNQALTAVAGIRRIPLAGKFELTPRCNLKCMMCYVRKERDNQTALAGELPAAKWLELAGKARDAGMLYLMLTGGEIFLYPQFRDLYEGLCEMGLEITMNTNATLITRGLAAWLGKAPPRRVAVTVYGASPSTYERVCGVENAFEQTLKGMELLVENGIPIAVRTTVIQQNRQDFEKLSLLAEKYGVKLEIVNYIFPVHPEGICGMDSIRLEPEELARYEREAFEYQCSRKAAQRDNSDIWPVFNPGDEMHFSAGSAQGAFQCEGGRTSFWVGWDGCMLPCGLMKEPFTMPLQTGFISAWEELGKKCADIPVCNTCAKCSHRGFCMACPARLKSETGIFHQPAEYLCSLAKARKRMYHSQ